MPLGVSNAGSPLVPIISTLYQIWYFLKIHSNLYWFWPIRPTDFDQLDQFCYNFDQFWLNDFCKNWPAIFACWKTLINNTKIWWCALRPGKFLQKLFSKNSRDPETKQIIAPLRVLSSLDSTQSERICWKYGMLVYWNILEKNWNIFEKH